MWQEWKGNQHATDLVGIQGQMITLLVPLIGSVSSHPQTTRQYWRKQRTHLLRLRDHRTNLKSIEENSKSALKSMHYAEK